MAQDVEGEDFVDEVSELAELAGYSLTAWQAEVIRDWSLHRADGGWVHRRCGASVPRQAGKSVDAIVWTVFLVSMLGYSVLWTDHNYSTTCEMLKRFKKIFGARPNDPSAPRCFNRLVKGYKSQTAQEAYEFSNGAVLCFSTRTASASLGYSFDVIIYDEAQLLDSEQMQTIQPTTASGLHHNTQSVFVGTPTRAGCRAEQFQALRGDALAQPPDDDVCWTEYGVDEVGDVRDESRWALANPSIEAGVADINAIRAGIRALKNDELAAAQEYLGYWLPKVSDAVLSADEWAACLTANPPMEGELAYGVKYSPDGACVALAAAVLPKSGAPYVELVEIAPTHKGTMWLARWLLERAGKAKCAVIDGLSGAGTLCDRLDGAAPRGFVVRPGARDVATAAATMLEAVQTKSVGHIEQPALDASATGSSRRKIGASGGWGWGGEDSAAIEAASLALWGVKTSKRRPGRKARVTA